MIETNNMQQEIEKTIEKHYKKQANTKITFDKKTLETFEKWRRGQM